MRLGLTAVLLVHSLPKLFDGSPAWQSVATTLSFINISQLSEDHSWIQGMVEQGKIKKEDAKHHPQRGLLLQALGNSKVEPYFTTGCLQVGDVFVLCSDGLTEVVSNNTIGFVLNQDGSPQKTADKLVELANENGGPDNISVVVAKILPGRPSASTVKASKTDFLDDKL